MHALPFGTALAMTPSLPDQGRWNGRAPRQVVPERANPVPLLGLFAAVLPRFEDALFSSAPKRFETIIPGQRLGNSSAKKRRALVEVR